MSPARVTQVPEPFQTALGLCHRWLFSQYVVLRCPVCRTSPGLLQSVGTVNGGRSG